MRMHLPRTPLLGLLAAILAPIALLATSVEKMGLQQMVDAADAIVIGHARGAETVWVNRNIYTRYRIAVDEALLGGGAGEVFVVVPGGVDLNRRIPIAMAVPDAPMLARDEHVALLLTRTHFPYGGDCAIVGFNQGRITLKTAAMHGAVSPPNAPARLQASPLKLLREKLMRLVQTRGTGGATGPRRGPSAARAGMTTVGGGQ